MKSGLSFDVVVIGGGQAGCSAAADYAGKGLSVCIVSEGLPFSASGSKTPYAALSELQNKGVTVLKGDRVLSGVISGGKVESVFTRNLGPSTPLNAETFILATGKFFSRGLMSDKEHIWEPVFNADVIADSDRTQWYNPDFYARQPYMDYGVRTDSEGRVSVGGAFVGNLYATGGIIGHEKRND